MHGNECSQFYYCLLDSRLNRRHPLPNIQMCLVCGRMILECQFSCFVYYCSLHDGLGIPYCGILILSNVNHVAIVWHRVPDYPKTEG